MKTAWIVCVLFWVGVLFVACATTQLTPGQTIVRRKCGACHSPPAPGEHSSAKLRNVLVEHQRRFTLTDEQVELIKAHLAKARAPAPDTVDR